MNTDSSQLGTKLVMQRSSPPGPRQTRPCKEPEHPRPQPVRCSSFGVSRQSLGVGRSGVPTQPPRQPGPRWALTGSRSARTLPDVPHAPGHFSASVGNTPPRCLLPPLTRHSPSLKACRVLLPSSRCPPPTQWPALLRVPHAGNGTASSMVAHRAVNATIRI